MQICVFCITSAKILIFYINWLCFLLLSLIALCFGVFPSDTMISNAFSVHLLKFIYDTHSSISPSFLRKLLLARRTWISYSHPHTFSETVSLASFWVLGLSNTWFPWIREKFFSNNKSGFTWGGENGSSSIMWLRIQCRGFYNLLSWMTLTHPCFILDQKCAEDFYEFRLIQTLPFGTESI